MSGHRQQQSGNQAVSRRATANLFKASDGYVLLAVNNEKQYRCLMEALAGDDAKIWETRLNAAGAPCASIWRVEEVIEHRQIVARGAMQTVDSPYGPLRFMGSGFQLAHGGGKLDSVAPLLGAHTDAVLREFGYTEDEIAGLRAARIV